MFLSNAFTINSIIVFGIILFSSLLSLYLRKKITSVFLRELIVLLPYLIVWFFLSIKSIDTGIDTYGYYSSFIKAKDININEINKISTDIGYALFCKIIAITGVPYIVFSFICNFIICFGHWLFVRVLSKNPSLSTIVLLGTPNFALAFSGLRQSISIAFFLIALAFFFKAKKIFLRILLFSVFSIIAIGFHHSAFVILFIVPLLLIKPNKTLFFFFQIIFVFTLFFNKVIYSSIYDIIGGEYPPFDNNSFPFYALFLYVIFSSIYILYCLRSNKTILCDDYNNYFKIFFIGFLSAIFMSFSNATTVITRLSFIFLPILSIVVVNLNFNGKFKILHTSIVLIVFSAFYFYLLFFSGGYGAVPYNFYEI